ncbi:shikimate kinase [Chenggangzhangella methanolivorans]|uniref:Shikimate kinase n=1 Tax=Chenggangzhangella methanolivorans TaxID=1437009 RepID=A0A9E6RCV7_9HYPH|nr:shikimate kinase [Chenggangzhangella methanolivorans]QZO01962.1 shikimate kinase [Chenggangzhangella methanolivorans]
MAAMQQLDDGRARPDLQHGGSDDRDLTQVREALAGRSVVLIGMMGSGKTSVGRRLAAALDMPFVDADAEIERVADMSIPEIFERYGESFFRDREAKVVARLLEEGQKVLATGGGAWMNPDTRARIGEAGVSVWLSAEFDVLLRRVRKRGGRPLLARPDPEGTLRRLVDERYPTYALADVTIQSRDAPHERTVGDLIEALRSAPAPRGSAS